MQNADNFMWFPEAGEGVKPEGETSDTWFARLQAFEVARFGFSMKESDLNAAKGSGSGSEAGRAKFQQFQIDKLVDLASAMLYKACSLGTKLPSAMLAVRKVGGRNLLYLQYIFRDVMVTGITWSGGIGVETPVEQITFSFQAMGFQYIQQKDDGSQGRKLQWSWSTAENQSTLNVKGLGPPPPFLSGTQS